MKSLMLGDIDLKSYIDINHEVNVKSLEGVLKPLEKRDIKSEKIFREQLQDKIEKFSYYNGYPKINLSFLQEMNEVTNPFTKKKIIAPMFSAYNFYNDNRMNIQYEVHCINNRKANVLYFDFVNNLELDKNIIKHMLNGIENKIDSKMNKSYKTGSVVTSKKRAKIYAGDKSKNGLKESYPPLVIESYFNGLIPKRTLRNIEKSVDFFGKNNIYLICETKPEEWNIKSVEKEDPLIIGLKEDQAYFIDHFNCTSLEELVKDNYTQNKFN